MSQNILNIAGRVLDRTRLQGVAGLRVEAQSGKAKENVHTDQRGAFTITFDQSRHPGLFTGKSPDIKFTFKVFAGETLLITTKEAVPRDTKGSRFEIDIVLNKPDKDSRFSVKGMVRRATGEPFIEGRVQALHEVDSTATLLGESVIDDEGRYLIRYAAGKVSGGINLRVQVQGEDNKLLGQSDIITKAKREETLDISIFADELINPIEAVGQGIIRGRVVFDNGAPAPSLVLRFYDRGFACSQTKIGEADTTEGGIYSMTYTLLGRPANVEVRLILTDEDVSLCAPKLISSNNEVINLVAPASVRQTTPEYQRLTGDLSRHIGPGAILAATRENAECQDLTFLHRTSGWDGRLIALAATAHKLSQETGVPPDALYGLLRVGVPTEKQELARLSATGFDAALGKAIQAGIVSLDSAQIAGARTAFENFARSAHFTMKAPGLLSTPGQLLAETGLTEEETNLFKSVYSAHKGPGAELWQKARAAGLAESRIARLQTQGKLAHLTLNNATLARSLQQDIDSPDKLDLLVEADFYKTESWKARLRTLSGGDDKNLARLIPPAYTGERVADRLDAYASDLARKVRISFPTQVIARQIENDEMRLGQSHSTLKAPVQTFMRNAKGLGFELGRNPVESFVRQNSAEVFRGIDDPAVRQATTRAVKTLQRIYQITPTDDAMRVMLDLGFTSAHDVMSFSRETFIERFGDRFSSHQEAGLVYRKAEQVGAVTYNFFTTAKQLDSAPPVYALSPQAEVREEAKAEMIRRYPTMEQLFGSLDFCECEHCRSVLSPAAYFVDLLKFLDTDPLVWQDFLADWKSKHSGAPYPFKNPTAFNDWKAAHPGKGEADVTKPPYEFLVARRPDLPNLSLTCENTNVTLPYIDLVNEILEYYVANDKLEPAAAHDTGNATTAELLAEPQNTVAEAYDKIKDASYPLTLPFDLWLETVRRFYDNFQTPLWEVLDTFRPADELFPPDTNPKPYYRAAIFSERIGVSPSEYAIFTHANPLSQWHKLYGFDTSAQALTSLKSAKTLSRRLGVSYKELLALVRTAFINPRLKALVILQKLGFEVAEVFRYKGHAAYPPLTTEERAAFEAQLTAMTNKFQSLSFNAKDWLDATWAAGGFNKILVLADPNTGCNFDQTTLRYSEILDAKPLDFLKLNLFVRLWKKLGWTIEETDRALQVLIPSDSLTRINNVNETDANRATAIGPALKTALIYIAHLEDLAEQVKAGDDRLIKLLTFWSNLPTTGDNPLYARIFLTKSVLNNDSVFDHPLGNYLSNLDVLLKDHLLAVQGALNLTALEVEQILVGSKDKLNVKPGVTSERPMDKASLSLGNVSLLYRHSILAKALRLTIEEMLSLQGLSGLDPFEPLEETPLTTINDDHPFTKTLRFIELAGKVKQSGFRIEDLLYLLRHNFDPVGKYREDPQALPALVKLLAGGLSRIREEQGGPDSISDELLRQKLGIVLTPELTASFLGAVTGTMQTEVIRENVLLADKLDPKAFVAEPDLKVSYDEVTQRQSLIYRGLLLNAKKEQIKGPSPSPLLTGMLDQVQAKAFESFVNQVGAVISLLMDTVEHYAVEKGVLPADRLDPMALAFEPAIRVSYDAASGTQRLAYRGLLLNTRKQQINTEVDSDVLKRLLNSVQNQARAEAEALIGASILMIVDGMEFKEGDNNVLPSAKLDPAAFAREPSIRVVYDDAPAWDSSTTYKAGATVIFNGGSWTAKRTNTNVQPVAGDDWNGPQGRTQRLTLLGLLSDAKKGQLKLAHTSTVFAALIDRAQDQGKAVLQSLRSGILQAADFNSLFGELAASDETRTDRRASLAKAFLPFILRKLNRQFIVDMLSTDLGSDHSLTEALLTVSALLTDPGEPALPLIEAFAAAADQGVTAKFFTSEDATGAASDTRLSATVDTTGKPAGTKSAKFEGYMEVPAAGPYRFFVQIGKKKAQAEFRLGDRPDPLLQGAAAADNTEMSAFVDLKPGVLYSFTLAARKLGGGDVTLRVQGEGLPKGSLSRLKLYASTSVERVRRAHTLLAKALHLITGLGLTEREIRYLVSHAADFDDLDLNKLPTGADDVPVTNALFHQFVRLADYARLKRELAGDTEDLISVFENARRTHPSSADPDQAKPLLFDDLCARVADITRRDIHNVQATASHLGFAATSATVGVELLVQVAGLTQEEGVGRLWDALQIVEKLGISVESIVSATDIIVDGKTSTQRLDIARGLRNTVRAQYETENWQHIAQPIFDKLRQRKRDALVAYIMHKDGFDRIEQLFEYFLIDAGMEPVVQTSRLRLAISSVQLFVQRCLLNLEFEVSPLAINSKHWEWMKRYRVWEANRKIFLFPENWLEPEFRDDKTHLFQELESALLQDDVSNELAEDAFFKYLKGLDEIARLEIVTFYLEENSLNPASNTLHVIGRTHGIPHKYFYRRYAHQMWTPWEPVATEIEGDHVAAVVWRGRLHLFWVTFIEKAKPNQTAMDNAPDTPLGGLSFRTIAQTVSGAKPKKEVEIHLSWSEHFQGEWTPAKSSGTKNPIIITADNFNKDSEMIWVYKEFSEGGELGVRIHLLPTVNGYFRLASKNSLPESTWVDPFLMLASWHAAVSPYLIDDSANPIDHIFGPTYLKDSGSLNVTFIETIATEDGTITDIRQVTKPILRRDSQFSLVRTTTLADFFYTGNYNSDIKPLVSPFFYRDNLHTFFVEPTLTETTIEIWDDWVIPGVFVDLTDYRPWEILVSEPVLPIKERLPIPDPIDPVARFQIRESGDWVVHPETLVHFDGGLVGEHGRLDVQDGTVRAGTLPTTIGGFNLGAGGINAALIKTLNVRR